MIDIFNGQLDRYEIRDRIGSGGMARVYKAWDTNLERLVAIKVLHEHLADDPTFKERFEREAKFIASFNHPNIVQVYDFAILPRNGFPLCYMVMSYIPGKTLREVLEDSEQKGEKLPRERVRHLVDDLTSALGYAHRRGMVHRDVKPGNIILDEHGKAILTDFGIARMTESSRLTADGVSTGTPIYMSPEQASGQPGDMRSDLYSLGIIVYEMLSGRPPFVDDTSLSVMLKHLNTPPPAPSEFIGTHQFDNFTSKALAKKPDDRFQNADELVTAFHAALGVPSEEIAPVSPAPALTTVPEPSAVKPPATTTSVLKTLSHTARENPHTSMAIVVAAFGAIALLILLFLNSDGFKRNAQPEATLIPATASALITGTYFTSSFSPSDPFNIYWQQDGTEFLTRELTDDGFYRLHNIRPGTAETALFSSDTRFQGISIDMVGRLETSSQPASAYGIVFRYHDENNYNVFAVDGIGRFSIWTRTNGEWIELRDEPEQWTPNPIIQKIGKANALTVTISGNMFVGYVNSQDVVHVQDDTLEDGRIGIYFATDDGEATVSVDTYRVYSTIPSMTSGS